MQTQEQMPEETHILEGMQGPEDAKTNLENMQGPEDAKTNLENMQIPEDVETIIDKLNQSGFEAYAVGGCVRDTLLARTPGDWDITTSALPLQVKQIFKKTIDTGIQHGTVTVMMHGTGYEVTTYRIDGVYEDGRHPKSVEFTDNLIEDLKRRDFTINAMAYSRKTGIVDAFEGKQDLNNKVIRCVGEARERFTEDALRILRAVRFAGQLGFAIEAQTYQAICEIAPNLSHVSKERILTELTKLLLSAHPERLMDVWRTGMTPYIAEGFSDIFENQKEQEMTECLKRAAFLPPLRHMRFAAAFYGIESQKTEMILKELKSDNDTIKKTSVLVGTFGEPFFGDKVKIRHKMNEIGAPLFLDSLEVKRVLPGGPAEYETILRQMSEYECGKDSKNIAIAKEEQDIGKTAEYEAYEAQKNAWELEKRLAEEILADRDCISLKELAVTGGDLIQAGMKPGKKMGEILHTLLEAVLQEPQRNQKELLLRMAQDMQQV